jgi:hypothetical protein
MATLHILVNLILIVCLLSLPFLMLSLTYSTSTKSRFNKLTVFSTGMLCAPLLVYMWIYRDTLADTGRPAAEPSAAVHDAQNPPAQSVEDLKFSEFFKLPIGSRGLEITQRLTALDGKKVRIKGYMVQQESAKPGYFMLTPFPAKTSEDDDSMADDLPPSTVFVHVHSYAGKLIAHRPGLLEFTGHLSVGPKEESDTRVSSVRLMLDSATSHAMIAAN